MDEEKDVAKRGNTLYNHKGNMEEPAPAVPCTRRCTRSSTGAIIAPLQKENRRVISKPKRIVDNSNLKQVHSYYLDKRVKLRPPSLETIFEVPKEENNEVVVMSLKKFNRRLIFDVSPAALKSKVTKRRLKAKKLCTNKKKTKITIDFLMETLSIIETENNKSSPKSVCVTT